MRLLNRFKWFFVIGVVFTVVLATNLIDRRNFRSINDSVVSLYEERLVVKNIILDMVTAVNQKEVAFLTQDTSFLVEKNDLLTQTLLKDLGSLDEKFLLGKEKETLKLLQKNVEMMLGAEENLMKNQFGGLESYKLVIKRVNDNVDVLAHIQLQAGKQDMIESKRNMETIELFTQLEIYFLIFLAVIVLLIIVYKPSRSPGNETK